MPRKSGAIRDYAPLMVPVPSPQAVAELRAQEMSRNLFYQGLSPAVVSVPIPASAAAPVGGLESKEDDSVNASTAEAIHISLQLQRFQQELGPKLTRPGVKGGPGWMPLLSVIRVWGTTNCLPTVAALFNAGLTALRKDISERPNDPLLDLLPALTLSKKTWTPAKLDQFRDTIIAAGRANSFEHRMSLLIGLCEPNWEPTSSA